MADLKKAPARKPGYESTEARRLARELGGVAIPARWKAGESAWEIGGPGAPNLPHIVVMPIPGVGGRTVYVVLADNTAPVKTALEAMAEQFE